MLFRSKALVGLFLGIWTAYGQIHNTVDSKLPKECKINVQINHLQCTAVLKEEVLVEAIDVTLGKCGQLQGYEVKGLSIQSSDIIYLPLGKVFEMVKRCGMISLGIWNTALESISNPYGDVVPDLEGKKFYLGADKMTGVHHWPWDKFKKSLSGLLIAESQFVKLPDNFLKTVISEDETSILHVSVLKSKLKWLGEESLACTKCTSINLSDNEIDVLPDHVFGRRENRQLRVLALINNKITGLSDEVFSNLLGLHSLELSGNPIKTLSEKAFNFGRPNSGTSLGFTGSNLKCSCELNFLKKFHLGTFDCLDQGAVQNLQSYFDKHIC